MSMGLWNDIKWHVYRFTRMPWQWMKSLLNFFDCIIIDSMVDKFLLDIDDNALPFWDVVGLLRDYIGYIKTVDVVNPGYVHISEVQSAKVKEQGNG